MCWSTWLGLLLLFSRYLGEEILSGYNLRELRYFPTKPRRRKRAVESNSARFDNRAAQRRIRCLGSEGCEGKRFGAQKRVAFLLNGIFKTRELRHSSARGLRFSGGHARAQGAMALVRSFEFCRNQTQNARGIRPKRRRIFKFSPFPFHT